MKIDLTICGVDELPWQKRENWTHVISIWEKEFLRKRAACREQVKAIAPGARLLFCFFEDIGNSDYPGAPKLRDVKRILEFTGGLTPRDKLLVHCRAGVSRSTATAYAILCQHTPPGEELENLRHVQSLRTLVMPNRLIIRHADKILKRDGAMMFHLRRNREFGI